MQESIFNTVHITRKEMFAFVCVRLIAGDKTYEMLTILQDIMETHTTRDPLF